MRNKSEVDLRVAQELKNNRDFIYQTNQALQNLNQSILALAQQNEKLRAQVESDHKQTLILNEQLQMACVNHYAMSRKQIDAFEKGIICFYKDVQEQLDEFKKQTIRHEVLDEKFKSIAEWMKSFEVSYERLSSFVNCSFGLVQGKIASEIDQVRKDLTPDPDAVDPIKKEVEDLLTSMRVDFQGLIKELAVLKRDVAYGEKKFENIYTLLERLKCRMV